MTADARSLEKNSGDGPSWLGGSLLNIGELSKGPIGELGHRITRTFVPSPFARVHADEEAAKSFSSSVGKQLGISAVGLLGDIISKAKDGVMGIFQNHARQGIFDTLRSEDDEISRANPELLADAYHTMVRFAPTLATDKNAVKTFLREAVLMGTGPNVMSIKQLADAENAVNPRPGKSGDK